MEFLNEAWFWILIGAASEIIGMSPLKSNSVVQLILTAVNSLKPKK